MNQNLHFLVAMGMVFAVGVGATYLIVRAANATEFSYVSTDDSFLISAEIKKSGSSSE